MLVYSALLNVADYFLKKNEKNLRIRENQTVLRRNGKDVFSQGHELIVKNCKDLLAM